MICIEGGAPTRRTALVLDARVGHAASIVYCGPMESGAVPATVLQTVPQTPGRWGARLSSPPDDAVGMPLHAGGGDTWLDAPGLEFLRTDGRWRFRGRVTRVEQADASVTVHQEDAAAELQLVTTLSLSAGSGALSVQTQVRNTGADAVEIRWLTAAQIPLPPGIDCLQDPVGDWCGEFRLARTHLSEASVVRDVREGRSSHRRYPALLLSGADDVPWVGAQLCWSGDHRMRIDRTVDGARLLQAGVLLHPGELVLAPGESWTTPQVFVLWSRGGAGGPGGAGELALRMHETLREAVLPDRGMRWPRPVHLNTWEAVYFRHSPQRLMELAQVAATVGVERFVLDDGWFQGRIDDSRALGDWTVDEQRYPEGLDPLVERVTSLGMEFGLWVEPEMVNDDSELARTHPGWIRGQEVAAPILGRNQRVLDLGQDAVRDHLFAQLDALLTRHPIGYLKWDHNRTLTESAADGSAGHLAQTLGFLELLERVRRAHPDVEIESCASGGGRADWGVLRHAHRIWTSDSNDPVVRARIMTGALNFLAPEVLGVHIGPERCHTTGRQTSIDFRAAVALLGCFGLELDLGALEEDARLRLAAHVARYQRWRDVIHGGIGRTVIAEGDYRVRSSFAVDAARGLLVVLRIDDTEPGRPVRFRLPDARVDVQYRLRAADPQPEAGSRDGTREAAAPWLDDGPAVPGSWLRDVGVEIQLPCPHTALVLELEAVRG